MTQAPPLPWTLSWADVDPTTRDFHPDTVPPLVAALIEAEAPPAGDADWREREHWLQQISTALADRYGVWAVGWRWALGEGDLDGGPITAWCCLAHSVTTPESAVTPIAAAVVEWHDWLADLAGRFNRFLPMPPGDLDGWERATAHLVTEVGDRTQYQSGWYDCVTTVLGWFLEAAGVEPARRKDLLEHALGGRFQSWVEPPREVVDAVAGDFALRVSGDHA